MILSNARRKQANILYWILIFVIVAAAYQGYKKNSHLIVIRSDGTGYYEYLPAFLQYHDPWIKNIKERRTTEVGPTVKNNLITTDNGRSIIKYPMGTAILWSPFYAGAYLYTLFSDGYPSNSYSQPFNNAVALAAIFYLALALYLLWSLLRREVTPYLLFITFFCMVFGTNLFHYATFDACFSHVYAFFTVTLWIYALDAFFQRPSTFNAIFVGIAIALVFLVRNVNIVYALLFLPYFLNQKDRSAYIIKQTGVAILVSSLLVLPQFVYLYLGTGRFILSSYALRGEGFSNMLDPYLFFVTFSIERGFFLWSPIALFGVYYYISGLFNSSQRVMAFFVLLILSVQIFLVASWWSPHFGGSFGHRAFVDFLPFCFIGASYFLSGIGNTFVRLWLMPGIWLVLVAYTSKLMLGYWSGLIPFGPVSVERWKAVLFKGFF